MKDIFYKKGWEFIGQKFQLNKMEKQDLQDLFNKVKLEFIYKINNNVDNQQLVNRISSYYSGILRHIDYEIYAKDYGYSKEIYKELLRGF